MVVPHRLELIDDAMLRPGRLGKLLYVPLPDATDRIAILRALVRSGIPLFSSHTLPLFFTRYSHISHFKNCIYLLTAFQPFLMKFALRLTLSMSLLN
jgi:SpoVK/Ycf46/Vps4 family AAA+-type ATPase